MCVARADLNDPDEVCDFTFDVVTDPSNPDVTFKTGHSSNFWYVWSQVSYEDATPANLGDLVIDSTGSTDNYRVRIENPNNGNPGAANLNSAVLKDESDWTGWSSLSSSTITGDLNGALEVVRSGGTGGSLGLVIEGDLIGSVTAARLSSKLDIKGDLSGDITITELLSANIEVDKNVSVGATIDIQDMAITNQIRLNLLNITDLDTYATYGQITLHSDLGPAEKIISYGEFGWVGESNSGFLDLTGHDVDGGEITFVRGGEYDLRNVGTVKNNGVVTLTADALWSQVFGTATIYRVNAGGTVNAAQTNATFYGSLTIENDMAGTLVLGSVLPLSSIVVLGVVPHGGVVSSIGSVDGLLDIAQLRAGEVTLAWIGATGTVRVRDMIPFQSNLTSVLSAFNVSGQIVLDSGIKPYQVVEVMGSLDATGSIDLMGGDVGGTLTLEGGGSGDILNGGDVTGVVTLADASWQDPFSGTATFGDVSGSITTIANHLDGTLTVDSIAATGSIEVGSGLFGRDLGGTIHVTNAGLATGTVAAGGEITVGGDVLYPKGSIQVDGPMQGSVTVKGLVSGDVLINDKLEGGTLTFEGNTSSTGNVRVNNMISADETPSLVDLQGIFDGDMLLDSGIPANQTVQIAGKLDVRGEIDLNAADVAGTLSFDGGSGNVIDGGAVTGSVSLGDGDAYSGNATFSSVSADGEISTTGAAGIEGVLKIRGVMAGTIGIGGVGGSPASANLASTGKIWVTQDLSGTVSVGGSASGDIVVDGGLKGTGTVNVTQQLKGTGRILIGADCRGDIVIGEQTVANSLISMRDFTGTITINDSEGNFNANGDISIGVGGIPFPAVTFDGSILVMDNGAGGRGDLVGDINITGCHPENHDYLDICIEGDVVGSVNINQGACSYPVCGYQCGGGACP